MVRKSLVFLAVIAMVLFVQPVRADVLYDSGVAWNLTNGQFGISGTGYVADPFTLSSASTITSINLGLWNGAIFPPSTLSSPPKTLSYAIYGATGPALYSGDVTLNTLARDSIERFQSEFLLNVRLNAGTYYLKLSNGLAADGHDIGWGENQLASRPYPAWSGSSSDPDFSGFRTLSPNVPAESFIINGTTDSGPSPVPEPTTMLLLGLGLLGLGGFRKRLFKK